MNSNISYQGKLTIKVKDKKPVKSRNTGTFAMFNMLYYIFANKFSRDNLFKALPCYISAISKPEDMSSSISYDHFLANHLLIQPVEIVSREVLTGDTDKEQATGVKLSALLTYDDFLSGKSATDCVMLLLDGNQQILAYTDFSYDDVRAVTENINGQAAVEWSLKFDNNTKNSEDEA